MPSFCVVSNCEQKYTHSENISFHKFPHHSEEILKKWIDFTGRGFDWKPSKWSTICSRHFLSSDFRDLVTRKCLKRNAVPSITMKQFNFEFNLEDLHCNKNEQRKVKKYSENDSNLTLSCRLCGHHSIFNCTFSTNSEIFNLIKKCFPTINIQQSGDKLPKSICSQCLEKLHKFSDFIDHVTRTQEEFQQKCILFQQKCDNNLNNANIEANNNNNSNCNIVIAEKQLKIKQEPIVRIKQENFESISNNFQMINNAINNNYQVDGYNNDKELNQNYYEEQKSQNQNLPLSVITSTTNKLSSSSLLNSSQDINNCEIMEIISLDDVAFIDIPDDDILDDYTSSNQNSFTENESKVVNQYNVLPIFNLNEWDHNYTKKTSDIPALNNLNYKTEKFDENESFCNTIRQQQQNEVLEEFSIKDSNIPSQVSHSDIIVINDEIIKSVVPISTTTTIIPTHPLLQCNQCQMKFYSEKIFEEHNMKCEHILENIVDSTALSSEAGISENNFFICSICDYQSRTINELLLHKNQKHRPAINKSKNLMTRKKCFTHSCPNCNKIFLNKLALNNHRTYICKFNKNQLYECRYCKEKIKRWILLKKHERFCKRKIKVVEKKEYSPQSVIKQCLNKKFILPNDCGRYPCQICGKSYSRRGNLYKHERKHRPISQWNLKCSDCEKLFDRIYDLRQHLSKNECIGNNDNKELEQILYICTICGKEFKTIQRLETHNSIHSGKKPYVCEQCGKSFPCYNNLHQHRITHTDLRRYKCDLCEKSFKRKDGLNQHKKAFHLKLKPHECPVCKHRYALKTDMLRCRHSNLKA